MLLALVEIEKTVITPGVYFRLCVVFFSYSVNLQKLDIK